VQLAQALSRAGGQTLAVDTPSSLDLGVVPGQVV
jgi:hypothetical protein